MILISFCLIISYISFVIYVLQLQKSLKINNKFSNIPSQSQNPSVIQILPMFLILLIFGFLNNSFSKHTCVSSTQLQSLTQNIQKYDTNINLINILNTDYLSVMSSYSKIPNIGNYKIQIQQSYQINAQIAIKNDDLSPSAFSQQLPNITNGYNAQNNLWIKFSQGLVTIQCNLAWSAKVDCGTFIQVHFPFDQRVLIQQRVQNLKQLINLAIQQLCAGTYHIWLIYSTRIGGVVKSVKPIFISYPFCQC